MFGSDQALGLGGGGVRELGGQRFPGQGAAGAEVSGVLEPAVGFVPGDPQPLRDDGGDRGRPQLDGGGFGVQAGQQALRDARHGPGVGFHPPQHLECIFVGQCVDRQPGEFVAGGVQHIEHGDHHVAIADRAGTHTWNTISNHRQQLLKRHKGIRPVDNPHGLWMKQARTAGLW